VPDRDLVPDRTPVPDQPAPAEVSSQLLSSVGWGVHFAPHEVLGPHLRDGVVTIRTVRHGADAVAVVTPDQTIPARHEQDGVWVAAFRADEVPEYRLKVTYGDRSDEVDDGYRYLPTLGEVDQHLIREGRHEYLWGVLGAHVRRYQTGFGEVVGTSFAVWAPNARAVRVVGDFNGWDGQATSMRSLGSSGVWELFVPHVGKGTRYKFEIGLPDGSFRTKADPMARAAEVPPATASVVTESEHVWADEDWLERRRQTNAHSGPMSIYEVHLGSWRQGLSYRELATQLTEYVTWMGFTHVELMPVSEHPFGGSWGYQVSSYYAPTSRFGSPDDFRHLVDTLHGAGIGVILDWVPAHFPKDEWALAQFDGTPLYEDPDPFRGEQKDWGTFVFNFGRNEVRNFLVANAVYWLQEFHIDGLRVDAVASMLYLDYSRQPGQWRPNVRGGRENLEAIQFLQEANATAYRTNPGVVMIAEESTAWPGVTAPTSYGGLGFGLKWNMGWMNDTLRYVAEAPINRRYHHGELTFSLVYAFSEQYVLPLSHDEVVHGKGSLLGKMPGDRWQQLAGLRALFTYMWTHPGKNLLFMGGEFGQESEWAESRSLDWGLGDTADHAGVRLLVRDLNLLYRDHPALWADDFSHHGFQWLEAGDGDHNTISYLRIGEGETLVVVVNFAGTPHEGYRVALPHGGDWIEVLNTDSPDYGGSGVGNLGRVSAQDQAWAGRSHSVELRVPPLGAVILAPATE
jgi:1,4-alpha-glucan branching enzyme